MEPRNNNKNEKQKQNEIIITIATAFLLLLVYFVNYGECVQLIILFLYHLSTPEKKRGEITFLTPHSRYFCCVFV
jgi:hypothetical protein